MCFNPRSKRRQIQGSREQLVMFFFSFFFTLFKGSNGFHIEGKYHPLDEYLEHALKLVNMHNVKTKTQNFCFFVLKKHV